MNQTVRHDETQKRFYCTIDGHECSVDYDLNPGSPTIVVVQRTFVHPDLRGRGIAEYLLRAITEFALRKGLFIEPRCSYAVHYYKRHPEHAAVVVPGTDRENSGSCRLDKPSS
jgi:predicted GNAT family acetyltransferase